MVKSERIEILRRTYNLIESGAWKNNCICDTVVDVCDDMMKTRVSALECWYDMHDWLNEQLPPKIIAFNGSTRASNPEIAWYCWRTNLKEPRLSWLKKQIYELGHKGQIGY